MKRPIDKLSMTEADKEFIRQQLQKGGRMDMLKDIFEAQHELDQFIIQQHGDKIPTTLSDWIVKLTIAMESELDEVRGEVNWKWWKAEKQIDIEKLHEEIIDLWHFLISMSQRAGLTPEKVHEVYMKKREENFKRQKGTSTEKDYRDKGGQN